jgi:hypothetical protein
MSKKDSIESLVKKMQSLLNQELSERSPTESIQISVEHEGMVFSGEASSPKRGCVHVFLKEPRMYMGEDQMSFYDEMILDKEGKLSDRGIEIARGMLVDIYERFKDSLPKSYPSQDIPDLACT